MWVDVSGDKNGLLATAVAFTGDHVAYGAAMLRVLDEMPIACEHNLTAHSINHQAWIGHAAAYLAHKLPESITREAWRLLTDQQREDANVMADVAIAQYKGKHALKDSSLHQQMEITGL